MHVFITIVVTVSGLFLLSLAQPMASSDLPSENQPTQECIAAFSAWNETSCATAYSDLRSENATEEQSVMVCDASQECNRMIENITILCDGTSGHTDGNMATTMSMMEFPTHFDLNLLCTSGPGGFNCFVTLDNAMNVLMDTIRSCGTCTQTCRENLIELNSTFGCCLVEGLQAQMRNTNESMATFVDFIRNSFEECDLPFFQHCNGSNLPTSNTSSQCINATINLFGPDDDCSRAVQEVLDGNGNDSMISFIFSGDCPSRFYHYATTCSMGGDNDMLLQIANTVSTISQARANNGRSCAEFVPVFMSTYNDGRMICTSDFLKNQCSNTCKQMLIDVTTQYGCCVNTIVGEFIGRSGVFHEEVGYRVLTRDIYNLCGISSPGFCDGIDQPSYTDIAEQCIGAKNSFFSGDNTCVDYYLTLNERSSAATVNDAATAICASQKCKNHMRNYIDFLVICQLESFDDVEEDENITGERYIGYLDSAYLIGNTTCRVNRANNTCYSSILFDPQYDMVTAAFDINNPTSECASMMTTQAECSQPCMQLFADISASVGCCLGEYGRVFLGDEYLNAISTACNVSLSVRCMEIPAAQDVDGGMDDGANVQRGFGVLTILLFEVLTVCLLLIN